MALSTPCQFHKGMSKLHKSTVLGLLQLYMKALDAHKVKNLIHTTRNANTVVDQAGLSAFQQFYTL